MKRFIFLASILSALTVSVAFAAPDPDHDADRSLGAVSVITPAATDRWLLLDASNSNALGYVETSGIRAAIGLETSDDVTHGTVTAAGSGGLKAGVEGSVRGAITIYSNVNPFAVGINSAATPTGTWTLSLPPGAPGGANYLFNVDADGTGGWTDPATLGGDNLGSATAANVVTLFNSGTCSGYLKSDGTCDTPTGGYTNLTSFVGQTAWRLFYSNADGDVTELSLGADGEYLKSNGASLAPSWATPSGAAHDAVTLDTETAAIFSLSTQQLTLDSQTANYFFAAPNGSAGDPTFRAIVAADIPTLAASTISVADSGSNFVATNVETALAEVADELDGLPTLTIQTDNLTTGGSNIIGSDYALQFDTDGDGDLTDETWWTNAFLASALPGAKVTTASKAADYTIGTDSADEAYGGTIYVTSAATVTAPAATAGMNFTVVTIGSIAVSLDVNASDRMILDGTALADGDKATNTSTAGDTITCQYQSSDGWFCWSGTMHATTKHWTDGN